MMRGRQEMMDEVYFKSKLTDKRGRQCVATKRHLCPQPSQAVAEERPSIGCVHYCVDTSTPVGCCTARTDHPSPCDALHTYAPQSEAKPACNEVTQDSGIVRRMHCCDSGASKWWPAVMFDCSDWIASVERWCQGHSSAPAIGSPEDLGSPGLRHGKRCPRPVDCEARTRLHASDDLMIWRSDALGPAGSHPRPAVLLCCCACRGRHLTGRWGHFNEGRRRS